MRIDVLSEHRCKAARMRNVRITDASISCYSPRADASSFALLSNYGNLLATSDPFALAHSYKSSPKNDECRFGSRRAPMMVEKQREV